MHNYGNSRYLVVPVNLVRNGNCCNCHKVAMVIHFHYLDTLEEYYSYILNIPDNIDVYITTSSEAVEKKCNELYKKKRIKGIIRKKNLGRDISALLVAAKYILLQYEYIGFIHDKKAHTTELKNDVTEWIYSLWHNMLASKEYITNLLDYLDKHSNVGLLIPPILLGNHLCYAIQNLWSNNLQNTKDLLKKIGANIDIDATISPMSIGTVFWARSLALRKLVMYDWSYNDFPIEPLPVDGTLNHAVERSLEYVAKDAGFETKWIMSDEYVAYQYEKMNAILGDTLSVLKKCYGITSIAEVKKIEALQEIANSNRNKKIYIYGAGKIGRLVNKVLNDMCLNVNAYVITKNNNNVMEMDGIQIVMIHELTVDESDFFIVSVGKENIQHEIKAILYAKGVLYNNIHCW